MQANSSASVQLLENQPSLWFSLLQLSFLVPVFAVYMTARAWQGLALSIYCRLQAVVGIT